MSKAQDFLKMNEAGKGGKGKKLSATVTIQTYDSKLCSGYCPHAKTEVQQLGKSKDGSFSNEGIYYCDLFEERINHGKRRTLCIKVFGE